MQKEQIEREKEKNHTTKDQTLLLLPRQPSYECLLNEKKTMILFNKGKHGKIHPN